MGFRLKNVVLGLDHGDSAGGLLGSNFLFLVSVETGFSRRKVPDWCLGVGCLARATG